MALATKSDELVDHMDVHLLELAREKQRRQCVLLDPTRPASFGRRGRCAPAYEELQYRRGEVGRAVAAAELLRGSHDPQRRGTSLEDKLCGQGAAANVRVLTLRSLDKSPR